MSDFNQQIITEFREHGGHVETNGFGSSLVLLHTTGARSGEPRVNPAMGLRDGDDWFVVASAGGATKDPAWMHNLRAGPEVEIEVPAADEATGVETIAVHATELHGAERDEAFARFVARAPGFASYEEKAGGRTIPVVRLTPRDG